MPAEALFYHLTARPLTEAAPELLEKCLERGWRVLFRLGSPERVAAMTSHLWTWRDDAFLPHGDASDGRAELQPIYLTAGPEAPNGATVLFLADGATPEPADFVGFERVVILFDGRDEPALAEARRSWRAAEAAGCARVYWAQEEDGRWVRRSASR